MVCNVPFRSSLEYIDLEYIEVIGIRREQGYDGYNSRKNILDELRKESLIN